MVTKDKTIQQLTEEKSQLQSDLQEAKKEVVKKENDLTEIKANQQNQDDLIAIVDEYKQKVMDSMKIIEEKSKIIETINEEGSSSAKDKEIDQLKLELIEMKEQTEMVKEIKSQISDLESELKFKEDIIQQLHVEVENERQVSAHVQVTQEKEIMLKEKEISTLNTILTQERRVLLEKENEIKILRSTTENNVSYTLLLNTCGFNVMNTFFEG